VFVGGARDAESVWRWSERSAYRGPGTLTGAAHADRDTLVATATAHGLAGRPAPTLASAYIFETIFWAKRKASCLVWSLPGK